MAQVEQQSPVVDLVRMAELDGTEAFVSGEGRDQNPFTAGNELHAAWDRGWREAGWLEAQAHHE